MLNVAREMNLSETAFLLPQADGWSLRWFTPAREIELCGHATLASAHVLWESGRLPTGQTARFHTLSGLLTAEQQGEWIELNFPTAALEPGDPPPGMAEALGVQPVYSAHYRQRYLLELATEAEVRAAAPDFARLQACDRRGVVITARASTPGFDFVSRFFAVYTGIPEDPVTGSTHTFLTPYWAQKLGKESLTAYQASARGGVLRLRLLGERTAIAGQAVTVFKAEMGA